MKHLRHALLFLAPLLALTPWHGSAQPSSGRVLVLEDFEEPQAAAHWEGAPIDLSTDHVSHGHWSARVRLDREHSQISSSKLAANWSGYDRLLFDVYSDSSRVSTATIRIYDSFGGDVGQAARNEYFDGSNKIFLVRGWTHVEVKLTPLRAATFQRDMALDRIRRILLSFDTRSPRTVSIDNFRLVRGEEGPTTISSQRQQDGVSIIDNRWVTVRQVARPGDVPESPDITRLRRDAENQRDLLEKAIHTAQTQGIETIYAERRLVTADLGLGVRPLLPWFNNDEKKREMFTWVAESCRGSRKELEDLLRGSTLRQEVDDTQAGEPSARPFPSLKGRPSEGWFFRDDRGEPMMILSVHSPSEALQKFFATPLQHIESYTVGGGSRWTIDQSPVYTAFMQDPQTHRVGWDGWCGHLIRDLDSMGGSKKENVVICLESPAIRSAVAEYIRANIPKMHRSPELLYDIMAYELSYICYCDRSQHMFRQWLAKKHGTVEGANQCWGTTYHSFSEVIAPPVKDQRPLAGTNRGLWYDWARFNQDRFTDYLLWVRNEIRKIDPTMPLAAGGSSSMLAGHTGTSGIDEERIVNEVDDVIIHEGGGSTLGMDLQMALSDRKKPLADPEMSLGSVEYLLPHFLHGKSVAQLYHWPAQPANEFYSNDAASLAHSWNYSLGDVDEVLRVALDVRRLNKEIAAFVDAPAEIAILYSQTSTLQLPPEMLTWRITPFLAELRKAYSASQFLDTKVTFVTERQVLNGKLERYKLLLVAGARNLPSAVVGGIWKYTSQGGHVLITPESLLGDEYNRPREYLARLGVKIRETSRPRVEGRAGLVQGYDQSFSQDVAISGDVSQKLRSVDTGSFGALAEVETAGVRQVIDISTPAKVLFQYPDGTPAIVRSRLGSGVVDYIAASLEERGYAALLEACAGDAGVSRPIRVRMLDGETKWGVEARFAPLAGRRLLYISNFNSHPVGVSIDSPSEPVEAVIELPGSTVFRGRQITLPAHQTKVYELSK